MRKLKSYDRSLMNTIKCWGSYVVIVFLVSLFFSPPVQADNITINAPQVIVSASIGEPRLTIFGYTSPGAKVTLEGQGIFDETYAEKNGFFIFKNRFAPLSRREICLIAHDDEGGSSQPACLPPLPPQKNVTIGPLVLSPIVRMNKLGFNVHDFAVIQGFTVPNTDVRVKFFTSDINRALTNGIALPDIYTQSDTDGSFSINIPTYLGQSIRFYAQTTFNNFNSGKSTTLTVDILPLWRRIISMVMAMLSTTRQLLLFLIIIVELIFLIWFLFVRRKKKYHSKQTFC